MFPSTVPPARLKHARTAGDDYGVTDPPDWRSIDWTEHLHQMEVAGRSVNYVDIGEQGTHRPIVFIHGLGGQWQNWLENIPRFAQERRVVAMDLPGFGLSEMPSETITIELYGRVVAEMLRRLDAAPAVMVGNSMGGYVSSEVAIRAPEVVERLVLVASAGVSQMDLAERPLVGMAKATGLLATGNAAQMRASAMRPRLRHWFLSMVARHPSRIKADAAFEAMMKGVNKPGFEPALVANLRYDFRDRLPHIGCPVLVVWGAKDMIIPVRDADRFVDLIPGARKVILEDTGHIPMLERPPTFNGLLGEFLEYQVSEGELEGQLEPPDPVSS
jgi:pimeloyl-ACP methyl ester carboxylesterase